MQSKLLSASKTYLGLARMADKMASGKGILEAPSRYRSSIGVGFEAGFPFRFQSHLGQSLFLALSSMTGIKAKLVKHEVFSETHGFLFSSSFRASSSSSRVSCAKSL